MTYGDVYTKFLIEYDKANVTSSYPSLTAYEIASILDKAYLAIIAQKITGNNYRKSTFESDIKALEDLRPLLSEKTLTKNSKASSIKNQLYYDISNITRTCYTVDDTDETKYLDDDGKDVLESDFLYYISSKLKHIISSNTINSETVLDPVKLLKRDIADKYLYSSHNIPWMENPVCYIENNNIYVYVDAYDIDLTDYSDLCVTYIRRPLGFVTVDDKTRFNETEFELNDTMAEEVINLAILMSLEAVESTRLKTKEQTNALES